MMIGAILGKLLVRRSYDAINQGDVAAIMANWNDEATLTYPGTLSVSGTRNKTRTGALNIRFLRR